MLQLSSGEASSKVFIGSGDGTGWHDAANWFETGVPSIADVVVINKAGIAALTQDDFEAQSVTVAGKAVSSWTVDTHVYGSLTPPTTRDPAIYIRKDGTVVLSGSGVIVMHGPLKNSEERLATEASVMILLQ